MPKRKGYAASSRGKMGLHSNCNSFSRTLECRARQKVVQISADRVVQNDSSSDLPRYFVGSLKTFADKTVTYLTSFTVDAYLVNEALLNF